MKNFAYLSIIIISMLLFSCCKGNNKNEIIDKTQPAESPDKHINKERRLTTIDALYYNYILESSRIKPEEIKKDIPRFLEKKEGVLDASITDSVKINNIKKLMDNLQVSPEQTPIDARMIFILNYDDLSKDTLSLGGIYSDRIYLNGIEQIRDNELLFTLKNFVGFYPWLIGDDMFNMDELQDHSFLKPPFTSSEYYKQYQQALADK